MPTRISIEASVDLIARSGRGGRVLLPGGAMEATALGAALARRPELAAGLTFTGLWVPGVNRFDWAALHPDARAELCIASADWQVSLGDGRTRLFPLHYSAFAARLQAVRPEVQVLHLSRPGPDGLCTLGFSGDLPADIGAIRIGLVNAAIPPVAGAPRVDIAGLDAVCHIDQPPVTVEPGAGGPDRLVQGVSELVPDGATIQIGIGRLPGAILAGLADRLQLNIHSGLVGTELVTLMDAGALAADGLIRTGLVVGTADFLARMAQEPRLQLAPVTQTHGQAALAAVPRLRAINAALEADLSGQINCEYAGARRIAGIGGAVDFLRGARAAPDGLAITMIQAEGKDGASRIVPRLDTPTISIGRADSDVIVTEFGTAQLRHVAEADRPALMTALAPPAVRTSLQAASGVS